MSIASMLILGGLGYVTQLRKSLKIYRCYQIASEANLCDMVDFYWGEP